MQRSKQKKLEAKGWKVSSADDFLGLTPEESVLIEIRLALRDAVKKVRTQKRLTQKALAAKIKSSQSRIAKMEAGDGNVSIDLMLRSLIALGASQADVAKAIKAPRKAA